jgi:hypothetical protein
MITFKTSAVFMVLLHFLFELCICQYSRVNTENFESAVILISKLGLKSAQGRMGLSSKFVTGNFQLIQKLLKTNACTSKYLGTRYVWVFRMGSPETGMLYMQAPNLPHDNSYRCLFNGGLARFHIKNLTIGNAREARCMPNG